MPRMNRDRLLFAIAIAIIAGGVSLVVSGTVAVVFIQGETKIHELQFDQATYHIYEVFNERVDALEEGRARLTPDEIKRVEKMKGYTDWYEAMRWGLSLDPNDEP